MGEPVLAAPAPRERPILFSAPMVRAILAGTKTQTRRPVKPQPIPQHHMMWLSSHGALTNGRPGFFLLTNHASVVDEVRCPYGTRGDRLWVRETLKLGDRSEWTYAADGAPVRLIRPADDVVLAMRSWAHHKDGETCVSIHMPRWASRLLLEVTEVRVERLQAITEEDARAEGVEPDMEPCDHTRLTCAEVGCLGPGYRAAFGDLWDRINGAGSWDANPWVWVVGFRRIAS